MIREIQASEAKTHLLRLLDEVGRGEAFVITRHGRPVARVTPEADCRRDAINRAIANIQVQRKRAGRITTRELLAARDEKRKA